MQPNFQYDYVQTNASMESDREPQQVVYGMAINGEPVVQAMHMQQHMQQPMQVAQPM